MVVTCVLEVGLQGERAGRMAWALSSRCREAVRDGDGAAATQLRGRMMRAAMHDDALGGTASGVEGVEAVRAPLSIRYRGG